MEHDKIKELLEAFSIDALDPEERQQVQDHLDSGCDECHSIIQENREIMSRIAFLTPSTAPPPQLLESIMDEVQKEGIETPSPPSPSETMIPRWLSLGIAAILILSLGLFSLHLKRKNSKAARLVAELTTEKQTLQDELALIRREIAESLSAQAKLASNNLELNDELKTAINNNRRIKDESESLKVTLERLEKRFQQKQRESKELQTKLDKQLTLIATLKSDFKRLDLERSTLLTNLTGIQDEIRNLRGEVEQARFVNNLIGSRCTRYMNLTGVEPNPQAYGTVMIDPGNAIAIVYVYKLPRTPPSMKYKLWARRTNATTNAGEFEVSDDGSTVLRLDNVENPEEISSFMITAEPEDNVASPTGLLYMTSQ